MSHTSLPPIHRRSGRLILLLGFVCALILNCAPREEDALRRLAPGLPPEVADELARDDSDFVAFGRDTGLETLRQSVVLLKEALPLDDPDDYRATAGLVLPAMITIAAAIDTVFGIPTVVRECEILETPERGIPYRKLHVAQEEIFNDPEMPAQAKLDSLLRLLPKTDIPDMALLRPALKYPIAVLYSSIDDNDNYARYLRSALADARETQSYGWQCQILGALGAYHMDDGDIETAKTEWNEALEIARRHRFASQAARIASFYGWHYFGEGRLSLAQELLTDAQELCRQYKGGYLEIRYVLAAMEFQAELGSWEVVERLYKRGRALERQYIETMSNRPNEHLKHTVPLFKTKLSTFEARLLMQKGETDKADRLFDGLREPVLRIRGRLHYPGLLFHWAEGLVENGRPEQAIPIIREGLQNTRESHLPWVAAQFILLRAKAHLALDRYGDALESLEEFERLYKDLSDDRKKHLRRDWVLKEAVGARVQLGIGDRDTALSALENGLERLEASLLALDKGAQGYIWLSRCAAFRDILAELTAHDDHLSYGAELYWRSLYRHLGGIDPEAAFQPWTIARDTRPDLGILDHIRFLADDALGRITNASAVHLVYSVNRLSVRRWIVARDEIRSQVLDVNPAHLGDEVSSAWREMSTEPEHVDAPVHRSLSAKLHALARTLLPEEVLNPVTGDYGRTLLISSDGYLSRMPFEALNVGSEDNYSPLLERHDIAYLRHVDRRPPSEPGRRGVILVTEDIPVRLRDRYPLAGELVHALEEGETVARLNPGAAFFHGSAAGKQAVLGAWKDACFVYLATHVLRDPEVPYLALIPIAAPEVQSGPDAAYIDIADIRGHSFNSCELVVLSGCSSGAPYLTAYASAPSLGDVFLDAGAGAAVQTFWAIVDDNARRLMTSYVETWSSEDPAGVRGLNEVRRNALRGPNGIRHPFGWASYSIKLQRL